MQKFEDFFNEKEMALFSSALAKLTKVLAMKTPENKCLLLDGYMTYENGTSIAFALKFEDDSAFCPYSKKRKKVPTAEELKEQIAEAVEKQEFEKAAELKKQLLKKKKTVKFTIENPDKSNHKGGLTLLGG